MLRPVVMSSLVAAVTAALAAEPAPAFKVIVNPDNPVAELDRKLLAEMFLKKATRWPNNDLARPVDLSSDAPARERFSQEVIGRSVAEFLYERASDGRRRPDLGTGVHLGTQHGAKGLEWPAVFVLGDVSASDDRKEPDGERRLAYVAATRAERMLYLVRWPGCAPVWGDIVSASLVEHAATDGHPAWRPTDRVVVGLGDLWLDFAGREGPDSRRNRALARLKYGDTCSVEFGRWTKVCDASGEAVASLSRDGLARVGDRLRRATNARVLAMVRRTADQTTDLQYRSELESEEWWVPVVVAELTI
jgi:ATP-dependent DNA helicase RecQ